MHTLDMSQGSKGTVFVLQRIYNLPKKNTDIVTAEMTKTHLLEM